MVGIANRLIGHANAVSARSGGVCRSGRWRRGRKRRRRSGSRGRGALRQRFSRLCGLGAAEESGLLTEVGVVLHIGVKEHVVDIEINVDVNVDALLGIEVVHGRGSSSWGVVLCRNGIMAVDLSS